MKSIDIKCSLRKEISRQEVRSLRDSGQVPCVMYGGKEPIHFAAHASIFKDLIYTPNAHLVNLDIDGKNYQAILQEIQFHPIDDAIIHIDFLEINDKQPVTIGIPVKLTGTSEGVREGGKLIAKMRKIKIKGLAADLPDNIEIDITPLKIGSSVRVRDLVRKGITFLDIPSNVVVGVRITRNVVEETPAAAATTAAPAASAPAKAAAPSK